MEFLQRLGNGFDAFALSLNRSLAPETKRAFSGLMVLFVAIAVMSVTPGWTTVVFIAGVGYFLPTLAAWGRHETIAGILALNLLLGWTVLGWILALVWALSKPRRSDD